VTHTSSVAQVEEDIIAAGAEIIWVLEATSFGQPGTAEDCRAFVNQRGSDKGYCVGDADTEPEPGTFDDSPFSVARGFDMIVRRSDMRIVFESSHGTPAGNENLTGAEILAEVEAAVADAQTPE
jgi:hypothetical protein